MRLGQYLNSLCFLIVGLVVLYMPTVLFAQSENIDATVKLSICGNDVAESGEHCDGDDLRSVSCTDLGYDEGPLSCTSACTYKTSTCSTGAPARVERTFSPSGGTQSLTNESNTITVTVPSNAVAGSLTLELFSFGNGHFATSTPAPSAKQFIGTTYDIIFVNIHGRIVSNLNKPATIELLYTDDDLGSLDESTLEPFHYTGGVWEEISEVTHDTENNTLTFSTKSFSPFVIFGEETSSANTPRTGESSAAVGGGVIFSLLEQNFGLSVVSLFNRLIGVLQTESSPLKEELVEIEQSAVVTESTPLEHTAASSTEPSDHTTSIGNEVTTINIVSYEDTKASEAIQKEPTKTKETRSYSWWQSIQQFISGVVSFIASLF